MTNIDEPSRADNNHLLDRTVEIERLASLDTIDYETVRAEAAERLGFRATILDGIVKKKRRALGLESPDDDPGQGRAIKIADVLPWPEGIEGDQLGPGRRLLGRGGPHGGRRQTEAGCQEDAAEHDSL